MIRLRSRWWPTSRGWQPCGSGGLLPPPLWGGGGAAGSRLPPPPCPSPQGAGESHLDLRCLLHWFGKRILKATPESRRELDAPLQEGFSILAGPAGRERETRSFGSSAYCAGGCAVRGNVVLGHGGIRPLQRRAAAAGSAFGAWDTEPRYVQPSIPTAQSACVRSRIPALHGGVCKSQWPQTHGSGGDRRQSSVRRLRTRPTSNAAAAGQCLCGGGPHGSGATQGTRSQRNRGRVGMAGFAGARLV